MTNLLQTPEVQPVPLEPAHIPPAAASLARAFRRDPMFVHVFPSERLREELLARFFRPVLRYGMLFGEALAAPDLSGAAVWLKPGEARVTFPRMLRSGMLGLPFSVGLANFRRFVELTEGLERVHQKLAPEPHWFGMAVGVSPERQGRGLARALIRPVLEKADAERRRCYLETCTLANLSLYRRYGFEVVHAGEVVRGGPHFWMMARAPRRD